MRTLIYARFSSDLQNPRSIDDQVTDCRARAEREGWPVLAVFTDYETSGGAGIDESQRPGMNAMLARVSAGEIDQVLADTSSRVARDVGDSDRIRKLLTFHGARLFTLSLGEIDRFKGVISSLVDEQQRSDNAHNIRRGQRGRALAGMNPGGMAYGYRKVPKLDERGEAVHGLREIDADQAAIVLRIFTEIAAGRGVRAICGALNADGIASPSGRQWRRSTIHGDPKRRNGILRNELYRGQLIYNRVRKVQHPVSRKRTSRVNPESEWTIVDAPDLRIVSDDLWEAAQAQLRRYAGGRTAPIKRPRKLLSGKALCGTCGATFRVVQGGGKWNGRWGCAAHHDGRGCANGRTITTESFEKRVLTGLTERLLDPDLFRIYFEEYRRTWTEQQAAGRKDRSRIERRRGEAERRIARFVEAIGNGSLAAGDVRDAIAAAKAERDAAEADLRAIADAKVVTLHPGLAEAYQRRAGDLIDSLRRDDSEQCREAVRALIDRIIVTPRESGIGTAIEVHGIMSSIVELAGGKLPKCTVPLVPLGRIGRDSTLLKVAC